MRLDTDLAETVGSNIENGPGAQEMRSKGTAYKTALTAPRISEGEAT